MNQARFERCPENLFFGCCQRTSARKIGVKLPTHCLSKPWPLQDKKHRRPQNGAKTRQKYEKWSLGIFGVFLPHVACGAVLLFCGGPSFSQPTALHHIEDFICYITNQFRGIQSPRSALGDQSGILLFHFRP